MEHPDQKYINALLQNDMALLEEIYRRFSGKIKWMVLQNNGTETDAADIFQDALLSIYQKAKNQQFILTCPLEAFLYLICKNKWLNELSKRKLRKVTLSNADGYISLDEDSVRLAEECRLQHERKVLLNEKIALLGESCRTLLQLSWDGRSMDEVAGILKVTYSYARKKKSVCMAKLMLLVKQSPQFGSLKW